MPRSVFGVGVYLSGGSWGLHVLHNRFLHHPVAPAGDRGPSQGMAGVLHVQTALGGGPGIRASRELGAARLPALLEDAEISDNEFDGPTIAVLVLAHLGSVRISDNTARNCSVGVALFDEVAVSSLDLAGEYRLPAGAPQAVNEMRSVYAAALRDPLLAHLLLLGATFPLPDVPGWSPAGAAHIDVNKIKTLRTDATDVQRAAMTRLVGRLVAEQSPGAAAPAEPAKASTRRRATTADFNAEREPSALSKQMLDALSSLAELARIGPSTVTLDAALQVERNTIDCTVPVANAATIGSALYVLFQNKDNRRPTTATVGDNRLSSRNFITAAVSGLGAVTVTGNIVVGQRSDQAIALAVGNVEAAAITGNVVAGRALLPVNRPFPAPLDTWLPLNTIV
jgi:hypothetical protein